MAWWIYIVVGFVVGAFAGGFLTRLFYFPKNVGALIIAEDPDGEAPDYVFLRTREHPETMRQYSSVSLKIIDQTRRK